ncbi:MAG: sigma-70 family RNA polymerase sigma factor [Cytophagales bacterium]|nr:sigma-70 family RNA polymerase sigma factor [Cytophagales bacterium]
MEDQQILKLLQEGKHTPALRELYKGFPSIERLIINSGGSTEKAQDIFQEALVIFFEKTQDTSFQLSSKISTYLHSVCHNLWRNESRNSKNKKSTFLTEEKEQLLIAEDDVEAHLEKEEKFGFLDEIMEQLGDKCKQVLSLFYYQKMSMSEIASELNYSNDRSAKNQKFKCLERAKKMAKQYLIAQ